MFQIKAVEEIETHILSSVTFFLIENRAVCETMWKNMVQRGRPQMAIWRMRFAWWIPKAIDRHSENVILILFPLQQWLHERASLLRYSILAVLLGSNYMRIYSIVLNALSV
jgi:hypothetical protein